MKKVKEFFFGNSKIQQSRCIEVKEKRKKTVYTGKVSIYRTVYPIESINVSIIMGKNVFESEKKFEMREIKNE